VQLQPFRDPPAFEDAFLFSAQRFFIASDRRFLPAALMPPRRFLGAAAPAAVAAVRELAAGFDLRAAHRAFIAWDNRLLPAGVIPCGALALPAYLQSAWAIPPDQLPRAERGSPFLSCLLRSSDLKRFYRGPIAVSFV